MLQSKHGNLFFLPKACIPGYHNYRIPISQVPADKIDDDCIMCYNPLRYTPSDDEAVAQVCGTPAPPATDDGLMAADGYRGMMTAARRCVVTPCSHYYHEACFDQWLMVKPECAICRRQLKFYVG